ncbi:MAG: NADH-quinone oxidoreductase subunit A [Armatimonadota bacterium]
MSDQAISIVVFLGLGILFWMIALTASALLRPSKPSAVKEETYECGIEPTGRAWYQVHVRYYIYALLFVLFDVEIAFLYPWATVFRRISGFEWMLFVDAAIFLSIVFFGLIYVWRKGALEWE